MMKFKDSSKSVLSDILLWQDKPTQVAIESTYDIKVHPTTGYYNDQGAINFMIPPQPRGMMSDIDIVTKFKIVTNSGNIEENDSCTIVNNFANSLWELVEVRVADRVDLMQMMRNSYAYQTFYNYVLNSDVNREDYLFATQLFKMDSGKTKAESESFKFKTGIVNSGAADRSERISASKSLTVSSPLHCPLISTSKALPTNIKLQVSLTKNSDKFLLLADGDKFKVVIESVHLNVFYLRPHDVYLSLIEDRLANAAAPYFVTRPEIIIKPIAQSGRVLRINDIFTGSLPHHAFFSVQRSNDFEGDFARNPFTFIPFSSFQLHIDGVPYFTEPLEIGSSVESGVRYFEETRPLLQQLYKTLGYDKKGSCLINSKNIQQHFMVGLSLTSDRSSTAASYLNPQTKASTRLEIDFGYNINVSEDLILIVYAVYDRVIKINSERNIEIVE